MDLIKIRKELAKHIDENYKEGNQRTVPTAIKTWGVRGNIIRDIAKSIYSECELALFGELITSEYLEEQMIAVRLLGLEKNKGIAFELAMQNLNKIRDWCVCDTLATQSLSEFFIKNQDAVISIALKGAENENLWVRRFWIAALVPLSLKKNKGTLSIDKVLDVLDKVMLDEETYVQKAIHWVLREVTWRNPEKVFGFIKKWWGKASRSTLWQGSEKLSPELRRQLRACIVT